MNVSHNGDTIITIQAWEDEEAAKWMGQISLEQQGEEAQSEEQAQVCASNVMLKRTDAAHDSCHFAAQ
jgi:hypothetical protein